MEKKVADSIQNPESVYAAPADVLRDPRLSDKEKLKALLNWESNLTALLRADDENMTTRNDDSGLADQIARVQRAEREIKRKEG